MATHTSWWAPTKECLAILDLADDDNPSLTEVSKTFRQVKEAYFQLKSDSTVSKQEMREHTRLYARVLRAYSKLMSDYALHERVKDPLPPETRDQLSSSVLEHILDQKKQGGAGNGSDESLIERELELPEGVVGRYGLGTGKPVNPYLLVTRDPEVFPRFQSEFDSEFSRRMEVFSAFTREWATLRIRYHEGGADRFTCVFEECQSETFNDSKQYIAHCEKKHIDRITEDFRLLQTYVESCHSMGGLMTSLNFAEGLFPSYLRGRPDVEGARLALDPCEIPVLPVTESRAALVIRDDGQSNSTTGKNDTTRNSKGTELFADVFTHLQLTPSGTQLLLQMERDARSRSAWSYDVLPTPQTSDLSIPARTDIQSFVKVIEKLKRKESRKVSQTRADTFRQQLSSAGLHAVSEDEKEKQRQARERSILDEFIPRTDESEEEEDSEGRSSPEPEITSVHASAASARADSGRGASGHAATNTRMGGDGSTRTPDNVVGMGDSRGSGGGDRHDRAGGSAGGRNATRTGRGPADDDGFVVAGAKAEKQARKAREQIQQQREMEMRRQKQFELQRQQQQERERQVRAQRQRQEDQREQQQRSSAQGQQYRNPPPQSPQRRTGQVDGSGYAQGIGYQQGGHAQRPQGPPMQQARQLSQQGQLPPGRRAPSHMPPPHSIAGLIQSLDELTVSDAGAQAGNAWNQIALHTLISLMEESVVNECRQIAREALTEAITALTSAAGLGGLGPQTSSQTPDFGIAAHPQTAAYYGQMPGSGASNVGSVGSVGVGGVGSGSSLSLHHHPTTTAFSTHPTPATVNPVGSSGLLGSSSSGRPYDPWAKMDTDRVLAASGIQAAANPSQQSYAPPPAHQPPPQQPIGHSTSLGYNVSTGTIPQSGMTDAGSNLMPPSAFGSDDKLSASATSSTVNLAEATAGLSAFFQGSGAAQGDLLEALEDPEISTIDGEDLSSVAQGGLEWLGDDWGMSTGSSARAGTGAVGPPSGLARGSGDGLNEPIVTLPRTSSLSGFNISAVPADGGPVQGGAPLGGAGGHASPFASTGPGASLSFLDDADDSPARQPGTDVRGMKPYSIW